MEHVNELTGILQLFFLWNKARCECFSQIVIALFSSRTVNLSFISDQFVGSSKKKSNYRRIIRFIRWVPVTIASKMKLGSIIMHILGIQGTKVFVSMDRTCWDLGSRSINFLVIGVNYYGISIPVFFKLLPKYAKKGNSNTPQRIRLLKNVISLIGAENILCFSADREFVGKDWFKYLIDEDVKFIIRIKENTLVTRPDTSHKTSAKEVCKRINKGKKKIFKRRFEIWGINLYMAAARNENGELMLVVSNIYDRSVFKKYLKRWSIETLFKYLKTNGFNIEDTKIVKTSSLEVLFFILTLSVTWALAVSHSLRKRDPLQTTSHGRRRTSFFRRGMSAIRHSIANLTFFPGEWLSLCFLLIPKRVLEVVVKGHRKDKKQKILSRLCCGGT